MRRDFLEFFCGAGMAREGLGPGWTCRFANDFDARKCASYRLNWGGEALREADVTTLAASDLPEGRAALAWASFPCQDLSLAGQRAGLAGGRSGVFFAFWRLVEALAGQERAPDLVMLENVQGALTSHDGADFAALCAALRRAGYIFGAMVVDAALFLPQSRPRLFVLAAREGLELPDHAQGREPGWLHPAAVRSAAAALPPALREGFVWWRAPVPAASPQKLVDLLEDDRDVVWRSDAETERLLAMMSDTNRRKLEAARRESERGGRVAGCAYRRMRPCDGGRRQFAEARFDGLAGCLRTPTGGSSRQFLLVVEPRRIRSRLLSAREAARLMGLPDSYRLPPNYNEAYHLMGDGVVVSVVRHLARHLLEPILAHGESVREAAE
ncbi:DNA cytosine methyltransferase [Methylocella sp.]|uniref:DNA cytosine methyltransferase n=1 Tax=Methylocella sp. TaxID=1978226 RepID=UPI0035AF1BFC